MCFTFIIELLETHLDSIFQIFMLFFEVFSAMLLLLLHGNLISSDMKELFNYVD